MDGIYPIINHAGWKQRLDEFVAVLSKNKIRYWLDGGVLLGAIREKNFIRTDTDIDLGVFEFELTKTNYQQIKNDLDDKNWKCWRGAKNHVSSFRLYTTQIEFWRFNYYKTTHYYHDGWDGIFLFPKECLDTFDTINFFGTDYFIPHNPELYLETLYGPNWRVPAEMKKPYGYPNYYPNGVTKKTRP